MTPGPGRTINGYFLLIVPPVPGLGHVHGEEISTGDNINRDRTTGRLQKTEMGTLIEKR